MIMSKKNKKRFIDFLYAFILDICILILLLLSFSLKWIGDQYGNIGLDEIIFHMRMPIVGVAENFVNSFVLTIILPSVFFFLFFIVIKRTVYASLRRKSGENNLKKAALFWIIIFLIWSGVLVFVANHQYALFSYIKNQLSQSTLIEEEYVDPQVTEITFPENKRNLILIFIESAETSLMDKPNGGLMDENYIPEMTEIAKNNISFSHSELLEGATVAPRCGWTIAGLLAETCGLPLRLSNTKNLELSNSMGNCSSFMPGATSLGDILEDEGYKNVFLAGSDFKFAGKTLFFSQHGNYEIIDYNEELNRGAITPEDNVFWGFDDELLYEFAKEELTVLGENGQPFNFSLLTTDTHHPDGYVCELCQNEYDVQYGNVWRCASRQINEFLQWIQKQDFYDNTTVVIVGDHCSMNVDFFGDYTCDVHEGQTARKVYNVFINTAVEPEKEQNRCFTTMDLFPTILASMGVTIENDRLGLGTNLFSDKPTLAERFGYKRLWEELNKNSHFYNHVILYP